LYKLIAKFFNSHKIIIEYEKYIPIPIVNAP
jgi:hypothetical protein